MAGAVGPFKWSDFFIRWLFSFGLLTATYNPTGHSFVGWVLDSGTENLAFKVFVGVGLLILHLFAFSVSMRTLTGTGISVSIAFFSVLTWAAYSLGVRLPSFAMTIMWIQFAIATTLAGGMSLALFRQHLSGQITPAAEGGY
jgi:hypothetical protein